jgi:ferredoxin
MKKVFIEPGCISCGTCEFIAPEVFEVTDVSRVKEGMESGGDHAERIKLAALQCPVNVIKYRE